jgi:preprotein translocase subunit SecA
VLCRVEVRDEAQIEREEAEQRERLMRALQAQHAEMPALQAPEPVVQNAPQSLPGLTSASEPMSSAPPFIRGDRKVGRNEPCPCGSGRKYKQCHGSLSA